MIAMSVLSAMSNEELSDLNKTVVRLINNRGAAKKNEFRYGQKVKFLRKGGVGMVVAEITNFGPKNVICYELDQYGERMKMKWTVHPSFLQDATGHVFRPKPGAELPTIAPTHTLPPIGSDRPRTSRDAGTF